MSYRFFFAAGTAVNELAGATENQLKFPTLPEVPF